MADIDLVVTDEQKALGETLREFFAEQAPLERLHRPHRGEGFDRKTWAGVAELGLPAHLEVVAYLCFGYVREFGPEPELSSTGWAKRRRISRR